MKFRETFKTDKKPWLLEFRSSPVFILATVSIAVFTDIFLYGVIVPVIPFALTERCNVDPDHVQYWVSVLLAVYGACLFAASPIWGWISDRTTTRRAPLLLGLLVLAGATVLLTVGNSIGLLIAGRALQGVSAAVVWVTGLALLVDTAGPDHVGQTLGYVSLSMSVAILIAPLLGGVVFSRAGYYAVFGMCFGLIALDIILRLVMIERKVAAKWVDGNKAGQDSDSSPTVDVDAKESIATKAKTRHAMTQNEAADTPEIVSEPSSPHDQSPAASIRQPTRLPPVFTLLKSGRLLTALYGSLVQSALLTAFDSTLPIFVENRFHWNSLGAGLIFLPICIPTFLSPLAGWVADKYGPRWIATTGFLFAVPFLVLLRLVTYDSLDQKVLLCAMLALMGFSITCALPPLMAEISYVVSDKEKRQPGLFGEKGAYAQAYGLFNMAFAGGCLVGPIWGGLVNNKAGWGTMTWTLALFSGTTALPIALWTGGWLFGSKRHRPRSSPKTQDIES